MGIFLFMWWLCLLYAYIGGYALAEPSYWYSACKYQPYAEAQIRDLINQTSYPSDLIAVLSSVTSHSTNGFYSTITQVRYNDFNGSLTFTRIHGVSFCWGYVSESRCQSCVATAFQNILRNCSSGCIAYGDCTLRYWTNEDLIWNENSTGIVFKDQMSKPLDEKECRYADDYMRNLISEATESSLMFRATEFKIGASLRRYGTVQCSVVEECHICLTNLIDEVSSTCQGWPAWWAISDPYNYKIACAMKFGDSPFYTTHQSLSPPAPGMCRFVVLIIICGLVAIILLISFILWCYCKKAKDGSMIDDSSELPPDGVPNKDWEELDLAMIPFSTLQDITFNFSDQCKIGKGGFGTVYKGILPDGRNIAVKRMSTNSSQGLEELKNEVIFIAKLQHRNLVRLLGYCLQGNEKLLVYEYMPNGSLDFHLFGRDKQTQLHWNVRKDIIIGIAKGLLYLHRDSRLRVIHRDLKPSNILLDHNMTPKISDFGLARIFEDDQRQANTRRIAGTLGYIAPEYARGGLFSDKSDVFSFGVLVLEIISGKRNTMIHLSEHGTSLVSYAWRLWCEGNAIMLMDPMLERSSTASEIIKCIHIGLLCVQQNAADRPPMSDVAMMLGNDAKVLLSHPKRPAFSVDPRSQLGLELYTNTENHAHAAVPMMKLE